VGVPPNPRAHIYRGFQPSNSSSSERSYFVTIFKSHCSPIFHASHLSPSVQSCKTMRPHSDSKQCASDASSFNSAEQTKQSNLSRFQGMNLPVFRLQSVALLYSNCGRFPVRSVEWGEMGSISFGYALSPETSIAPVAPEPCDEGYGLDFTLRTSFR
jgi:hypothetical protein